MRKTVGDVMTASPCTVGRETSIGDAARWMEVHDVGSLPVVDGDGVLVGIVTDRDIAIRVVAAGKDPSTTSVGDVFTDQPSYAHPDEPLDEAVEQMVYRRVRRLPVVDDDRLVGMLAQADVVQEVKDKTTGYLVGTISQPAAVAERA
jgi:CBS domain-containing protein